MANFLVDPALKPSHGTTPCRSYPANAYGLFDMAGNVWEWVYDWYDARYYGTAGARNPTGPPLGSLRLVRGGSWLVADVRMLSCSHRHKVPPDTYSYAIGFLALPWRLTAYFEKSLYRRAVPGVARAPRDGSVPSLATSRR